MAQQFSSIQQSIEQIIKAIAKKSICTTKDKMWIKSMLESPANDPVQLINSKVFSPETDYNNPKKELSPQQQQLFALVKLASKFHINSDSINKLLNYLCCNVKIDNIYYFVHRRTYHSPELIPQQFYHFLKEKEEELNFVLGDYHSCLTEVHYLADSVIGFYIHSDTRPPIEWKSTNRISWGSV